MESIKQPWLYNEFAHTGVDHADPAYPAHYEANMRRFRDFEKEASAIAGTLALGKDDVVVDLGAGTGAFAVPGAKYCRKMIAVDTSKPMLDFAAQKAKAAGVANIEFVHAGFLTYAHRDEAADAVVSRMALHHLPDFWKVVALDHVRALLKKGGRFLLSDVVFSFPSERYEAEFAAGVEEMTKMAGEEFAAEAVLHYREEFSTFDWIMEEMLTQTGFSIRHKKVLTLTRIDYLCET